LSRQRFHQLVKEGVFPPPVYDIQTRKPHYTEEMLKVVMSVREKNVGINGRVVLFYARRSGAMQKKQISKQRSVSPTRSPKHNGLIDGLRGLGMTTVSEPQIEASLKEVYPTGTTGVGDAEVLRTVFVHLMRRH
jgi:hypothetical protein